MREDMIINTRTNPINCSQYSHRPGQKMSSINGKCAPSGSVYDATSGTHGLVIIGDKGKLPLLAPMMTMHPGPTVELAAATTTSLYVGDLEAGVAQGKIFSLFCQVTLVASLRVYHDVAGMSWAVATSSSTRRRMMRSDLPDTKIAKASYLREHAY